jgi:long-chain fatty acid transport protein
MNHDTDLPLASALAGRAPRAPWLKPLALALALGAPGLALATNGYFAHGYGSQAEGIGGVGIALPQDGLAAATNPAGTAEIGNRLDIGLAWFAPRRSADIQGNAFAADGHYSGDGKKNFYVPELGYGRRLSDRLALGLALYGNGGLNTDYQVNPYGRFGATGAAGINLEQLFITPSLAWKPVPSQSLGLAVNVAYQRFAAKGLGLFAGFSSDAAHVSDQGTDTSTGTGLRLGWAGQVGGGVTLGATWASRIHGRFDKYRGLFADQGRFDIPENYGAGLAWAVTPQWTVAADVQRILYSRVASVGNSVSSLFAGSALGSNDGPGFGWRDVTVTKVGVSHRASSSLTLRAGYSHNSQPVAAGETFFNILAPGTVQDHYTLGATWAVGGGELSGFFAYAPAKTVNGSNSIPAGNPPGGFGGGNANVRLKETIIGLSYGWKL